MVDRKGELSALLSSAMLVFVGSIVGSVAKLVERIVIGRILDPGAYGEVSVAIAIFTFGSVLALAGCTQGVARFVPRFDDERDRRGVWFSGLGVTLTLSIVFAVGLFAYADVAAATLFEHEDAATLVRLVAVALPFFVAFRIAVSAIRGYENTTYRILTHDLAYPVGRIVVITALLLAGAGIVAAGVGYLVAVVVACVLAHYFLSKLLPLNGEYRGHVRDLLSFSAPLVVSTVVGIMLTRTDTLMIAYFRTSYEVGQYEAAYPIAGGLLVILSAFGFLYLPIASRLDADGDRDAVDDIYATTTKWIYVVTFPAFVLCVAFPTDVMLLAFGPAYAEAATVLPILAVGFFVSAAAGRNRETLSALGATTWIMTANVGGLALNVLVNLVLIPRYGIVGASVASATSFAAVHLTICGVLARQYGITPLSVESFRTFVALPAVLFPWIVLVEPLVTISLVTLFPALVVVGLASLVVVGFVGGFEPDDVVVVDLVEDAVGVPIPFVRRFIPDARADPALSAD